MDIVPQNIPDVLLLKPKIHGDERGYFVETYRQDILANHLGYEPKFIQDNESKSTKGVLRGLHFQLPPKAQTKLVRVTEGEVLDVVVDIRKGSPWYGQHVSTILSAQNKHQFYIPRGFAHAFIVLSEEAIFNYKVDNYYSPNHDQGLDYSDSTLAIDWKLSKEEIKLSDKDQNQPSFNQLKEAFSYSENYYG